MLDITFSSKDQMIRPVLSREGAVQLVRLPIRVCPNLAPFKYIADHANAEICWVGDPAEFPIFTETYMARLAKYWVAR